MFKVHMNFADNASLKFELFLLEPESVSTEWTASGDQETTTRAAGASTREAIEMPPNYVLGVFGLSQYTKEEDLQAEFSKYGPLEKVNLIHDYETRQSKGFGFVYYKVASESENGQNGMKGENEQGEGSMQDQEPPSAAAIEAAIECARQAKEATNGMLMDGRQIRVDYSKTRSGHEKTPGMYMGRVRDRYGGERRGRGRDTYGGRIARDSYRDSRDSRDYRRDDYRSSRDSHRDYESRHGDERNYRSRDYESRRDYDSRSRDYEPRTRDYDSRTRDYEPRSSRDYESRSSRDYESRLERPRDREYDRTDRDQESRSSREYSSRSSAVDPSVELAQRSSRNSGTDESYTIPPY